MKLNLGRWFIDVTRWRIRPLCTIHNWLQFDETYAIVSYNQKIYCRDVVRLYLVLLSNDDDTEICRKTPEIWYFSFRFAGVAIASKQYIQRYFPNEEL